MGLTIFISRTHTKFLPWYSLFGGNNFIIREFTLFDDVANNRLHSANGWIIVNNELERTEKDAIMA